MGKALDYDRVIIFGGQISAIDDEILKLVTDKDFIICADKGYEFALQNKISPNLIVGDFDSAPFPSVANCEVIKLPKMKDDTDLNFAVKLALEKDFKRFLLCGVTGGRLDQTAATVFTMNFILNSGGEVKVVDKGVKLFITNSSLTVEKPEYNSYLSVFPLGEKAEGVSISGALYPLENATFTNDFPLGVSNEFLEPKAVINVKKGTLLVMVIEK